MKIIVNSMTKPEIIKALKIHGFDVYKAPINPNLPEPVNTHPDMQISFFDGIAVCDPELKEYYDGIFKNSLVNVFSGNTKTQGNYPWDIAYNIKVVGNNVFHNFRYTDGVVTEKLKGRNFVNVSQGYSGCSISAVGQNAIITADKAICDRAQENGLDALLISNKNIVLEPYEYGFIGGASFFCDNTVYFFGDISTHPDYSNIHSFCKVRGTKIVSLCDGELFDYGSAFTFE